MDWYSYDQLCETPLKDYHFFKDYLPETLCDSNGSSHCLLVLWEHADEGLFIHSRGQAMATLVMLRVCPTYASLLWSMNFN